MTIKSLTMKNLTIDVAKPSKEEQRIALESYNALEETLKALKSTNPEIEIEETEEKIKIPIKALKLLARILKDMSQGKPVSLIPLEAELTTQSAAEYLGCSRPHIIKLIKEGAIPFTLIGRHRRIKYDDLITYKKRMKATQKELLIKLMQSDEQTGMYDS